MTNNIKFLQPGMNSDWKEISLDQSNDDKNIRMLSDILLSAIQMQNVVILSGSGTSLGESGGPSMKDLWDYCTKVNSQYSEDATKIFDLIGYDYSNENLTNIEELLSICESYLQITTSKDRESVAAFVKKCKGIILEKCRFNKTQEFLETHIRFLHKLSRRRIRDSRLNIFTTNYDTSYEEAASEIGITIIDGFSFSSPRQYDPRCFDYDIVRRSNGKSNESDYLEGVFKLFKLHGSTNWRKTSAGNVRIDDNVTADDCCMIFPARGKYQQSYIQPHLELMARYLSALREPNTCIIIVGFGFNDDHLSEPILSAIRSNPHLKTIIVNKCISSHLDNNNVSGNNYWGSLDECRKYSDDVYFIESTFDEFTKIIPDLKALTPAEKITREIKQIMDSTS